MTAQEMTLAQLVGLDAKASALSDNIRKTLGERQEHLKLASTAPRKLIEDKIADAVPTLFDLKVIDLLLGGWSKYRELQQFTDPKHYPPEDPVDVPLIEHEVVSVHHPALEVSVGGVRACWIDFDLTISLFVKGCVLEICGGRIRQLTIGSCRGRAVLTWHGNELWNVESKEVLFTKPIHLEEGIPLGLSG